MTIEIGISRNECQRRTAELLAAINDLAGDVKELNNWLRKDNVRPSVQTRLDRVERILALMIWALGVMGATWIAAMAGMVWKFLIGVVAH